MNDSTIATVEECVGLTLEGRMPFPQLVQRLLDAGIERYSVDLCRAEYIYYLPGGESHVVRPHEAVDPVAERFPPRRSKRQSATRSKIASPTPGFFSEFAPPAVSAISSLSPAGGASTSDERASRTSSSFRDLPRPRSLRFFARASARLDFCATRCLASCRIRASAFGELTAVDRRQAPELVADP